MGRTQVHIVGAGLAGLAAAVRLADGKRQITIYEAAKQAGGRCRSYYDPSLEMVIDNGNHLLLSGNHEARHFLKVIGSENRFTVPKEAEFPFIDLANGDRWVLKPNSGSLPWWLLIPNRRVPGTKFADYLGLAKLILDQSDVPIAKNLFPKGLLYERLWAPFLLAALNTDPQESSNLLARAVVLRTLAKGGSACRPMIASPNLSAAFIEPAIAYLNRRGANLCLDYRLRGIEFAENRVHKLDFGDEIRALSKNDQVILAGPASLAAELIPHLAVPQNYRAIVNAHFQIAAPSSVPPITGVINGIIEWLFRFEDRISVTISAADRFLDMPREELAQRIWQDVVKVTHITKALPPWQIIKEKRATFAATPEENARRPSSGTNFHNLWLAGDWTATGLPATIEGAILSGHRAADALKLKNRL
jgi:squalene-associated FAD-dependent desaturase